MRVTDPTQTDQHNEQLDAGRNRSLADEAHVAFREVTRQPKSGFVVAEGRAPPSFSGLEDHSSSDESVYEWTGKSLAKQPETSSASKVMGTLPNASFNCRRT